MVIFELFMSYPCTLIGHLWQLSLALKARKFKKQMPCFSQVAPKCNESKAAQLKILNYSFEVLGHPE